MWELLLIFCLTLLNGFFSAAEMAVVSSRRVRLELKANDGDSAARLALRLVDQPESFLATVQVGITLVSTLASAFGGARLAVPLAALIDRLPALQPYSHTIALGLVVLLLTYLSLVFGELVPKQLALINPEAHSRRIAPIFRALSWLASPAVRFLTWSSQIILRLLHPQAQSSPSITEEEIEALLEDGAEAGILDQIEQEFLQSVLDLPDTPVRAVMVPRTSIKGVPAGQSLRDVLPDVAACGFSRLPIFDGDLDHILGILHARDLLGLDDKTLDQPVESLSRPAVFTSEGISIFRLLETFKRQHTHMAIVLDEYSGTAGLISLQDVLEEIVGDLSDEHTPPPRPSIRQHEPGCWLVDGLTSIEHLREALGLPELPGEQDGLFETLSGFVMSQLGRIPATGEAFIDQGLRFEVLQMQRRRVGRVRITQVSPPAGAGSADCAHVA